MVSDALGCLAAAVCVQGRRGTGSYITQVDFARFSRDVGLIEQTLDVARAMEKKINDKLGVANAKETGPAGSETQVEDNTKPSNDEDRMYCVMVAMCQGYGIEDVGVRSKCPLQMPVPLRRRTLPLVS